MRATYETKMEAIALCQDEPAWMVKERLGLDESVRTIQRWCRLAYGKRPTHKQITRRDVLRDAVVATMMDLGHDPHRCGICGRVSFHECRIRKASSEPGVGSLVFVCSRCTRLGDV